jgi:hypothetical protein
MCGKKESYCVGMVRMMGGGEIDPALALCGLDMYSLVEKMLN